MHTFRRILATMALAGATSMVANAGLIMFSINGGVWNNLGSGGAFDTGANGSCGVGANCNVTTNIAMNNVGGSGVNVNGGITFTTTDVGGVTTSALERLGPGFTIDDTAGGNVNFRLAFFSDLFDASAAGAVGVGISGTFQSDNGGLNANADTQAQMNFLTGGGWNNVGPGSFALTTGIVGNVNANVPSPTPFWAINTAVQGGGVTELVGAIGVDLKLNSEVVLPMDIEDDDVSALTEDTPEPGTFALLDGGLAAFGLIRLKRRA